jgi:hypothetical protein
MKPRFLGTICLGFWLTAALANAQTPNRPKNLQKPPRTAVPAPLPPLRAVTPEEKAHQAIVEEQERRDREAEAERDRDDL